MRTNHKFPFVMTKKSLVVYIVFTVLMGLFLFFVRGDMVGKCAACIVCPMLSVYLIYAYCKERKADMKAHETKAQYMNGSYFESPEWHVRLPRSGNIYDVEIELNEFQVQMAIDKLSTCKIGEDLIGNLSVNEHKENE